MQGPRQNDLFLSDSNFVLRLPFTSLYIHLFPVSGERKIHQRSEFLSLFLENLRFFEIQVSFQEKASRLRLYFHTYMLHRQKTRLHGS